MPQSHTSDYEPNDSEHGTDHRTQKTSNTKFFPTSTREIFERKPLFRSTSLLSSHSRSRSGSISSGSLLGSSSSTINSSNSNSSGAIYSGPLLRSSISPAPSTMEMSQTPKSQPRSRRSSSHKSDNHNVESLLTRDEPLMRPRRLSIGASDARFSEYLSSTSSWDCEWEDDDEFPEMRDPVAFPYRPLGSSSKNSSRSHNRDGKGRSSASSSSGYYSELEVTTLVHGVDSPGRFFPDPLAEENDLEQHDQQPQPSTSRFAAAGILRASCPSLNLMKLPANTEFRRKLRDRHADDMSDISVSTADIGPPKTDEVKGKHGKGNAGKFMNTSKSSGCLTTVNVRGLTMLFLNRPITLRFTPSGLTESHRIVWVSETGNHAGTVKWVGKIRGTLYAGIEFEKPIGNSSGIYGYGHGLQTRLFTCKLGYGRFLPVDQLILYEDFYENQKTGFICIICRDDFIEPGQVDDLDLPEKIMVATKCGHLFHHRCLNQWFNEKSAAFQHCPYCQNPMERNDTIRIFPAQVK